MSRRPAKMALSFRGRQRLTFPWARSWLGAQWRLSVHRLHCCRRYELFRVVNCLFDKMIDDRRTVQTLQAAPEVPFRSSRFDGCWVDVSLPASWSRMNSFTVNLNSQFYNRSGNLATNESINSTGSCVRFQRRCRTTTPFKVGTKLLSRTARPKLYSYGAVCVIWPSAG